MGYRKKSRNRSQKNLVPKKNIGTTLEIFRIICVDLGPGLVPFPGFLHFFGWYRNRSRKNLVPKKVSESVSKKMSTKKSLGIGLEKFWYRKKSRNRSRKNLVPKKSLGIGIVQILGLVTHCHPLAKIRRLSPRKFRLSEYLFVHLGKIGGVGLVKGGPDSRFGV